MAATDCDPLVNYNDLFESEFKCDFCPIKFNTVDSLDAHIVEHFERKSCSECDKSLLRIGSQWYELHVDIIDVPQIKDIKPTGSNQLPNNVTESITEIKLENLDIVNDSQDFDECSENMDEDGAESVFCDELSLGSTTCKEEGEKEEIYLEEQKPKTKPKKRKMNGVNKKRQNKRNRKSNKEAIIDQSKKERKILEQIKCRICDRSISCNNFQKHLQMIHVPKVMPVKKRLECQICGKTFSSSCNLSAHRAIHRGITKFVCSYCGKGFRQKHNFTDHMNAHTGSRPYECEVCNKSFARLQNLQAHQLVHTGEKPCKCDIDGCDRAYAYSIDLKRHKFSAHGIYTKKHPCSLCSKVFPENKLLKKHLESHSTNSI